jgi:ADP-heptose:LPS heptosyltransferase
MKVNLDCRYYRGHIPCTHHKKEGIHCTDCHYYEILKERILIIKLGAAGDVIRTTPLLRKLKKEYPAAEITWLTYSPEVVPNEWVDNIIDFSIQNIVWLKQQSFEWLINLDKDKEAVALANQISASRKSGFQMNNFGKCIPISTEPEKQKWLTGLWDDLNKSNTLNYMQEIFAICGYTFNGEEYILPIEESAVSKVKNAKTVVGLNTGCGARWTSRLWPVPYWIELANLLHANNYEVILLGGLQEDTKNRSIAEVSQAKYFGTMMLGDFFKLINQCDVIVTQVTMAMHIAIALKKYLVLMNNIFNRNEFYLYNNGIIIEPQLNCLGCFKQKYDKNCSSDNCMRMIKPSQILEAIATRNKK